MEFVSRRYAKFLKRTDFGGDFEVHFTDSTYMEFVIWAKKMPRRAFEQKGFDAGGKE